MYFDITYIYERSKISFETRFWSQLSKEEEKNHLRSKCRQLEGLMLELFSKGGWNFRNRVTL